MRLDGEFRRRLLQREWLAGTFINLGSPLTAEIAGHCGFDWLLLDQEHGAGNEQTLLQQLQAVSGTPAAAVVRIAANEPPRFKRALDMGSHGVMVPYVSTADDARAAVSALRFPPHGMRGVARLTRATLFGEKFSEYYDRGHEWLVTMAQIETAGILLHDPSLVPEYRDMGFTVVALGSDGGSVRAGLKQVAAALRR